MADCRDSDVECKSVGTVHKDYIAGFVDNTRRKVDTGLLEEDMVNCSIPYYWLAGMDWFGKFGEHMEHAEDMRSGLALKEIHVFEVLEENFEQVECYDLGIIIDFGKMIAI